MVDSQKPESLALVQRLAAETVETARRNLSVVLSSDEGWFRIDSDQLQKLNWHARVEPNARALSDFLADMVPGEFLISARTSAVMDAAVTGTSLASDIRSRKLHSAIIEAGLAEQQGANGTLLGGSAFSAEALERLLDQWLQAGQHRGPFEDSPLSQIDRMLSRHAQNPDEVVQTRLGLLVPVVTAIHIWRLCELLPLDRAEQLGWTGRAAAEPVSESNDKI